MKLTPNFSLSEFTFSSIATKNAIDNSLPPSLLPIAVQTCELMERIRAELGRQAGCDVPIIVTSGYRSSLLNAAIGSGAGSDHPRAMAVDFKAPKFGTPFQIATALAPVVSQLGIGQLIHEFGTWVHVSTRKPEREVNRIITISARGSEAGIRRV